MHFPANVWDTYLKDYFQRTSRAVTALVNMAFATIPPLGSGVIVTKGFQTSTAVQVNISNCG